MSQRYAVCAAVLVALFLIGRADAAQIKIDENKVFKVGLRMQTRISVLDSDAKLSGDADAMRIDAGIRRAYFYFGGKVHPKFEYFAILAGDKIGQAGVDKVKAGVGTSFALRDAWVTVKLADELRIQLGRMYVPFFRGFGTEAAFAIQPLDLSDFQVGGMQPSRRAARDDGVTVWGNIEGGKFQYRLALMDAVDLPKKPDPATTVSPTFRLAGRVVANLISPEPGWFTKAAHLDGDGIVSIGAGFDRIADFNGKGDDYLGLTSDVYVSLPVGDALQVIAEGAVARIDQNNKAWTGLYVFGTVGAVLKSLKDLPTGAIHPYVRFEKFTPDDGVENPPAQDSEFSVGAHLYPMGLTHAFKTTVDLTSITPRKGDSVNRFSVQLQVSF